MNKDILILASKMLDLASDEFSNHGCNDLDRDVINSVDNEQEICKQIEEWNGDPGFPTKLDQVPDWMLMRFLCDKIKK